MFATKFKEWLTEHEMEFQSLSGVLDVCNHILRVEGDGEGVVSIPFRGFRCLQLMSHLSISQEIYTFQSLSGVLDVCNYNLDFSALLFIILFQSLSGVLDVCNCVQKPPEPLKTPSKSFNPFQGF